MFVRPIYTYGVSQTVARCCDNVAYWPFSTLAAT